MFSTTAALTATSTRLIGSLAATDESGNTYVQAINCPIDIPDPTPAQVAEIIREAVFDFAVTVQGVPTPVHGWGIVAHAAPTMMLRWDFDSAN